MLASAAPREDICKKPGDEIFLDLNLTKEMAKKLTNSPGKISVTLEKIKPKRNELFQFPFAGHQITRDANNPNLFHLRGTLPDVNDQRAKYRIVIRRGSDIIAIFDSKCPVTCASDSKRHVEEDTGDVNCAVRICCNFLQIFTIFG